MQRSPAMEFQLATGRRELLPGKHDRRIGAQPRLLGGAELQVLPSAPREFEQDQTVVGGDIDQAELGELLQHPLAGPVARRLQAE